MSIKVSPLTRSQLINQADPLYPVSFALFSSPILTIGTTVLLIMKMFRSPKMAILRA